MEGDPDRPGEVLVPALRDDYAAAGAILITVPADQSKTLDPGPYLDQLRVTIGAAVSNRIG